MTGTVSCSVASARRAPLRSVRHENPAPHVVLNKRCRLAGVSRGHGAASARMQDRMAAIERSTSGPSSRNRGPISPPPTAAPPVPAGACRTTTSRRSGTTATRRRSAPGRTSSCRPGPASSRSSRPLRAAGARRPASSAS